MDPSQSASNGAAPGRRPGDRGSLPAESCDCAARLASYERLASLYHELLGEEELGSVLERASDAVMDLVPCSSLLIGEVDADEQVIVPVVVRGAWQEETLRVRPRVGEGLIGWAVERREAVLSNEAHRDPRAGHVEGTPDGEPEAIACLPLVARGTAIGALSLYREGLGARFEQEEFELARRFADAVTLALAAAKSRARLDALAHTDDLTGSLNRRGLARSFETVAARAGAAGRQVGLLLVDLDQFKQVNDRFGHPAGDLLLQHVVYQLRACAPADACAGRLGGDEFALVLAVDDVDAARAIADGVAAAVSGISFITPGGIVSVTASIGVAAGEPGEATLPDLIEQADATMYQAKAAGGRSAAGL